MEDLSKDPKIAELPPSLDEQHESVCKISVCFEFDRILCGLRWWRRCPATSGNKRFTWWYLGGHRFQR
jgi:hypothetical protein